MNYENWCSRSNPGHIIIVVDRNEYMGEVSSGGLTLAQRMATLVNRFISQIVMECWQGIKILRCTKITIIGYGGIDSDIQVIYDTYIDILANDEKIPVDNLQGTVSDGQGGKLIIDYDLKRYIEPVAFGYGKVCDAFRKVKSLIIAEIAFSKTDSIRNKPVPVIIRKRPKV